MLKHSSGHLRVVILQLLLCIGFAVALWAENALQPGYQTVRAEKIPCNLHVIRIPRKNQRWEVRTVHAEGKALGLEKLSAQLDHLMNFGAVAAINGDYYVRQGNYAGDPRGLQIARGELISAPAEGASFWIDALDQPNVGVTVANFRVQWPDGSMAALDLNSAAKDDNLVLFTPAVGASVKGRGGVELILERDGAGPWLPLRPGRVYAAKVREQKRVREIPISPETLVLSVGRKASAPKLSVGDSLKISTETEPSLRGVAEALSGGPILVRDGKRVRVQVRNSDSYESSSMVERHPRSAIGWNEDFYFLVSADGRHQGVSLGLTLEEFGAELLKLGCYNAMNLDGGGSATLWFEGKVRNYLCDGYERKIANGLTIGLKRNGN